MTLRPVLAGPRWWLHDAAASRRIEQRAIAALPPHMLMQRAGTAVARLALALAPHARHVAVLAGPGNNGGDGYVAAHWLHAAGRSVEVVACSDPAGLAGDARRAFEQAAAAGVPVVAPAAMRDDAGLLIDALLGLGTSRAVQGPLADAIARINAAAVPVLAVDLPSGLAADSGTAAGAVVRATHTLSLLTLKPGLFTAQGRDLAGEVWFDDLGVDAGADDATACLAARPVPVPRRHASHKGSYGDVAVVGGAPGMEGAAWLAARAALAAGAGRVFCSPLDPAAALLLPPHPELMGRRELWLAAPQRLAQLTVVCGCGGGDAVRAALPPLIAHAARLLLDADALNAVAADAMLATLLRQRGARGLPTLLTPHPLEAARLLGVPSSAVQADRIGSARTLADAFAAGVVLKGSGTVVAAPSRLPSVNPTGNAALATAGTGDVLAGWIGGAWSAAGEQHADGFDVAVSSAFRHGEAADRHRERGAAGPLTASALIDAMARCGAGN